MAKPARASARITAESPIGVQEASAVAPLGNGTFLVVDDEHGIFRCRPDEDAVPLDAGRGLSDLEGICVGGSNVYVLAERDGSVWRFSLTGGDLTEGERLGKLPRLNKRKNQGWEGIYYAPKGVLGEAEELVAVHQVSPRRIAFFDASTLGERVSMRLPKKARKALGDLNDVAIHPDTHHLFVVSGKAGVLGELRVVDDELELIRIYPLETERDDVPEGITFDDDGQLWIVTDGEGMLREMKLNA